MNDKGKEKEKKKVDILLAKAISGAHEERFENLFSVRCESGVCSIFEPALRQERKRFDKVQRKLEGDFRRNSYPGLKQQKKLVNLERS